MSQRTRAAARMEARALVAEYLQQLRKVSWEAAHELEQLRKESSEGARSKAVERDWRREAQEAGLSPQETEESWTWFRRYLFEKRKQQAARETVPESVRRVLRHNPLQWIDYAPDPAFWAAVGVLYLPRGRDNEQDWRRDARAAGLSDQEIEDSWVWFRRYAFEAPPVLEETEQQAARETMPECVRRVFIYDPRWWFVGYDHDLLDDVDEDPIPDQLLPDAQEWRFWDDIGYALTDPSDPQARQALDRLARLVRLTPQRVRDLAEKAGATMEATKRRLIQESVLLSLGAADQGIRVGRRIVKDDPGHPITLEDVFGREGLKDVLSKLAEMHQKPARVLREPLESSLGGPFRPVSITDRAIYRNWLTKEIARRTVELLGQDLDISEAGRAGGSRRKEISYDEAESLAGVAEGELGADTQAFTSNQMRAAGEREDRERASFRTTDQRTRQLQASEKKDRMERDLAHRIDLQRSLDRIQREHEAPVLHQYIACVKEELLLMHDDVAAARALGWSISKVSDVKRRLNGHIAKLAAEQRWKSLFPNGL